jgi:hypothetical protein
MKRFQRRETGAIEMTVLLLRLRWPKAAELVDV